MSSQRAHVGALLGLAPRNPTEQARVIQQQQLAPTPIVDLDRGVPQDQPVSLDAVQGAKRRRSHRDDDRDLGVDHQANQPRFAEIDLRNRDRMLVVLASR